MAIFLDMWKFAEIAIQRAHVARKCKAEFS
jgi:hypothetical protein